MTVAIDQSAVLEYIGNGTANVFPITFPTFESSTIEASVSDANGVTTALTITTHFTLSSIGVPNTNGSLTLVNDVGFAWLNAGKLKTGYKLYISFAATGYQPMKGRDWGAFAPERFERTLDRLAMSVLAVKAIANKALGIQLGDGADVTLPALAGNEGKILQVNSTATGFEYGVTSTVIEGYATSASNSATTASGHKDAAAVSAAAALASQTAAAASATTANTAATNAGNAQGAAELARDGAAASEITSSSAASASITAKNAAVVAQTAAEAARDLAQGYALDASAALGYKNDAAGSATAAAGSATAAAGSAAAALISQNDAAGSATAAAGSATAAAGSAANALLSENNSATYEAEAQQWANLSLYDSQINLSFADSPYTINDSLDEGKLFIVDDSAGNVVINLPTILSTTDQIGWKVGILKKVASANSITVNRAGTDTIEGAASVTISDIDAGRLFYALTPTIWNMKHFVGSAIAMEEWRREDSIINALIFG